MPRNPSQKKIGRNDPCWCGSTLKYKKCHLNREHETPTTIWEADKINKKAFQAQKYCSCPESMKPSCSGKIVKAHTVSKSSSLKLIAEKGHVYGYKPSIQELQKNNGHLNLTKIGINQASTFTGFCDFHDKKLFEKFEDNSFEASKEQVFLIGYRSLAREFYTKSSQVNMNKIMEKMDAGKTLQEQYLFQETLALQVEAANAGLKDLKFHKEKFDNILTSSQYSTVKGFIIEFDQIIPIMCSGTYSPLVDFSKNKLQNLDDYSIILSMMCFSILVSNNKSYVIFTWLEDSDFVCKQLISSLREQDNSFLFSLILQYSFQNFENIFINPHWWKNLSTNSKVKLQNLILNNMNSETPYPPNISENIDDRFGTFKASVMKKIE